MLEMIIQSNNELAGKSIQDAGLRNLTSLFLIEIERQDQILSVVRPSTVLEEGDRLVVMIAASACVMTPTGWQTNLMVMEL
jgi:Trk K+ transport system NAD-binding subunit